MNLKDFETSLQYWLQYPKVGIPVCNSSLEYQIWDSKVVVHRNVTSMEL